jgi:hypothetical protein
MQFEMAQYILPFLAALIGIAVFSLHIKQHWKRISDGDMAPLLVVLISLLCTAYGVERLVYSENYAKLLNRLDQALTQQQRVTFTDDLRDIWSGIAEEMLSVDHTIRTVQSGDRPNRLPSQFKDLPDKIAARLTEQQGRFGDVRYRIVLVFEGAKKTAEQLADLEKANRERLDFYKSRGLEGNVELRVFDHETLTKFDILIIDEKHVNIGFDTSAGNVPGNVEIQNTMLWENQPALASKLARWFDETVWRQAKPFNDWINEQKK